MPDIIRERVNESTTSTKLKGPRFVTEKRAASAKPKLAPFPVVDLFAGPGGLGEGFSSLGAPSSPFFKISVSAEMSRIACDTLTLRAYFRALRATGNHRLLRPYYEYCRGERSTPFDDQTVDYWTLASEETLNVELGTSHGNRELNARLHQLKLSKAEWVLVGGPPCQAYSRVGRARNLGKPGYRPEGDKRYFLYEQYVRVVSEYKPSVFVMENVEGLLSAKLNGNPMMESILCALSGCGYRIHSLVDGSFFASGMAYAEINPRMYLVNAEDFGVPQSRHRVFLIGVRNAISETPSCLKKAKSRATLNSVIGSMPKIRSAVSGEADLRDRWLAVVHDAASDLSRAALSAGDKALSKEFGAVAGNSSVASNTYALSPYRNTSGALSAGLLAFLKDDELNAWTSHQSRTHMASDLRRYLFASVFARVHGRSPRGRKDFTLRGLAPAHQSWKSGSFADRFRVQVADRPATTITSHIAKDGHYFIHPDPLQCRSLSVREAARLQTFPDNYFFCGGRTQQYSQVGNAVPPYLARQIAEVVFELLAN